jgi:hypothetical protein
MRWCKRNTCQAGHSDCVPLFVCGLNEGGAMEEKDRKPDGNRENLDEEMERDTQIRRDTQVRGSLGVPASGAQPDRSKDRDEAIPEFGRLDDEDRMSDR